METQSHESLETKPQEGKVAETIEKQTAKIPSDIFLWTSISVMGLSLYFKSCKKDELALFIGQWAAPFLLFGIYNKIVKVEGSDSSDNS